MKWLRTAYALPFSALAMLIGIYQFNRAWIETRLARKPAAGSIKGIIFLTLLVWFAIWLYAEDETRARLNQAFDSFWLELGK